MLIRIKSSYFVAGVEVFDNGNKRCADIISYMENWSVNKIFRYCKKKGWKARIYRRKIRRKIYRKENL